MCNHIWERIKRPYQYQIDLAEGTTFCDSKIWLLCQKCMSVKGQTIGSLARAMSKDFHEATNAT